MEIAGISRGSLRFERAESARLAWAFAFSLAVHLLLYGTYHLGKRVDWQHAHLPFWLQPAQKLAQLLAKKDVPRQPPPPQQTPLLFLQVSPAQAVAEPPKEAKFYSDKNSKAANPAADKETDVPKIAGAQEKVAKTEDVPRKNFAPLQPSPPPAPAQPVKDAQPAKEAQEEIKPKPAPQPGDLALAKPEPALRPDTPPQTETHARPRTIAEALAQKQKDNRLPGEKMKQDGGVRRHLEIASLDAKETPFGAYDARLIDAISQRWFTLLDERAYASDSQGKVVLQFALHPDGRITDMDMAENTAGEVLGWICERAVLDPNPYAPWPSEMRRLIGADVRNIQFTFYYN